MRTFLIILLTVVLTGGIIGGGEYYYLKTKADREKDEYKQQIDQLKVEIDELKLVENNNTDNWNSYQAQELGLLFKYPSEWGEPYTHLENYSDQKELNNPYFDGQFYSICFSDGRYCAVGYLADYKTYESATESYYLGNEKSLDVKETGVEKNSQDETIGFVQKATVAGIKTRTKTLFYYLVEASGVGVRSQTYLNGKLDYPGILISAYYKDLSDVLSGVYDENGGKSEALENRATIELEALLNEKSNYQSQMNLYKIWLSTFSYI